MPDNSGNKTAPSSSPPLAIVGIGAEAGGLEAIERFFSSVPEDAGMAFVIVQHLDPAGTNALREMVGQFTPLQVTEIDHSTRLESNRVYISPPHASVACDYGTLLTAPLDNATRRSSLVDLFFQSLADSAKERAVGVVLSGAGADGTLGLKAIADAGGMTMAQTEDTAKFDAMPGNAVATGVVDHVLPPEQMFAEIVAYARHVADLHRADVGTPPADAVQQVLPQICKVLLERTEHDFQHYKSGTLVRRVLRRIQVRRLTSADEYLKLLQVDRDESQLLFRELLIGVTSFFRDPDTFAILAELVIPKLFEQRAGGEPVRVWIPGCATGEEAYTIAMLLCEATDQLDPKPEFQLFATDINERALITARQAVYPLSIAQQLTDKRLTRFFVKRGQQFEIVKELRERCTFSAHNLIADPPFSRLDLISCRNLLIYLGSHLQQKLIPVFHFSLRASGYLLLGPSENLAAHTELFRPVDQKNRISQRKETGVSAGGQLSAERRFRGMNTSAGLRSTNTADIQQISQRILLDEFAPRYVVVDDSANVLCMSGGLEKYFELREGMFQNSAITLARPGLRGALRTGLHEARRNKRKVTLDELTITRGDQVQRVQLVIQPMPDLGDESSLYMVVFNDIGAAAHPSETAASHGDQESLAEQLERELSRTREELETTVQEVERANEELKSSNEELLKMNEELQTTNEELERSKEKIQASMEAIARSDTDRRNLLDSTKIATLFLDDELRIKSYTPGVTEIYNVLPVDVGRPLGHLTHAAIQMPPYPAASSIDQAWPIEHEVETGIGRWFLRRIQPYLNDDGRQDGLVVTFYDITDRKRIAMRLAAAHAVTVLLAEADSFEVVIPKILEAIRETLEAEACLLWLADERTQRLRCVEVNAIDGLQSFVKASREIQFTIGNGLPGLVWQRQEPVWFDDIQNEDCFGRARVAADCNLDSGVAMPIVVSRVFRGLIEVYTTRQLARELELLHMLGSIGGEIGQFIHRHQLDDKYRDEEARKAAILEAALDCIVTMDIAGDIVDFNAAAERTFGYQKSDVVGRPLEDVIIPEAFRDGHRQGMASYLRTGQSKFLGQRVELTAQRSDGSQFPVELAINASHRRDGSPFFTGYLRDITERKDAERRALRDAEVDRFLSQASEVLSDSLVHDDTMTRITQLCVPLLADWAFLDLLDADGHPRRVAVAHANPADGELAAQVARFPAEPNGIHHPPARALYGGEEFLVEEFTEEMLLRAAQNSEHERVMRNVAPRSFVVVPLTARGKSFGALTLIASTSGRRYGEEDLNVARELARRASTAVDNSRLYEAGRLANIAKSEFLANMSHEIRTPMTAVLGYTDLLAAREDNAEKAEYLRTIKRNGNFLLDIINDILDLSKIEAGRMELVAECFAPQAVIADVRSMMDLRAREKDIEFAVEFDGLIPAEIESDSKRLKQILVNLIGNAIKFTGTGSVRLVVRFCPGDEPQLQFDIIDTGIGMTDDQQTRLFQPFSQGDASVTRTFGGTGLGLAISQRLAEMLGGRISLTSEFGRGSTFSCLISAGDVDTTTLIQPTLDSVSEPNPIDFNDQQLTCRVLVVDDRRDVRFLAKHFLEKAGATVDLAEDGQHALEAFGRILQGEAPAVDLILLDMQMPRLDGYQTASRLRQLGFRQPIIALTADAMHGDMSRCLQNGCDAYLSKPIDATKLLDLVASYTRNTRRA